MKNEYADFHTKKVGFHIFTFERLNEPKKKTSRSMKINSANECFGSMQHNSRTHTPTEKEEKAGKAEK